VVDEGVTESGPARVQSSRAISDIEENRPVETTAKDLKTLEIEQLMLPMKDIVIHHHLSGLIPRVYPAVETWCGMACIALVDSKNQQAR